MDSNIFFIENEKLAILVEKRGAQLRSLKSKKSGAEFLWPGDKSYWNKSSPLLFPIVGALRDGEYNYNGRSYMLGRHGFARDSDFDVVKISQESFKFTIRYSKETLDIYPFKFELEVIFSLGNLILDVCYNVKNLDDKPIFFSIGGHPAINLRAFGHLSELADFYLEFSSDESLTRYRLENNLVVLDSDIYPLNKGRFKLSKDMFKNDVWILENIKSKEITLACNNQYPRIRINRGNFPYLGLWAPMGAPFICIEPWQGLADFENHDKDFAIKRGLVELLVGEKWSENWSIEIEE